MPQDHMNVVRTRRGTRHNNCTANGAGSVHGPVAPNGCKAASITTSERTPAVAPNTSKPPRMVNGCVNYGYKGKSIKAAPKEGRRTSAAAAGKVGDGGPAGRVSVNWVPAPGADASACNSHQATPERSKPAAAVKNKGWKKFRRKKRDTEGACPERFKLLFLPPQEEENWENDIQDVTLTGWEDMCFGVKPYGPEDLLSFDLRDLTLKQTDIGGFQATGSYSPAVHHPRPVRWFCYSVPTEPGQFANAEE